MWWTFLIVIVGYFLIRFFIDMNKEANNVRNEGGMRKKYSLLVDNFLDAHPQSRIFKETSNYIAIGVSGIAGSQVFHLHKTYQSLTIQMIIKNNPIYGNMKMEWTFPDGTSQETMLMRINEDLENKFM